jgi:hypothetical protein
MSKIEPVCIFNWKQNWARHKAEVEAKPADIRPVLLDCLISTAIECRSGLVISAQASPFHYCDLRSSFMGGSMADDWHMDGTPPTCFEVMVSNEAGHWVHPSLLGTDDPAGWVSIEAIEETIGKNGGWVRDDEIPSFTAPNILTIKPRKLDL